MWVAAYSFKVADYSFFDSRSYVMNATRQSARQTTSTSTKATHRSDRRHRHRGRCLQRANGVNQGSVDPSIETRSRRQHFPILGEKFPCSQSASAGARIPGCRECSSPTALPDGVEPLRRFTHCAELPQSRGTHCHDSSVMLATSRDLKITSSLPTANSPLGL